MADDKKNVPKVDKPVEATAPTAENPAVTEPITLEPALTDKEAVTLEREGQADLFEMGEAVPDPGEQPIPIEPVEPVLPEQSKAKRNSRPFPTRIRLPRNTPARWWSLPLSVM